MTPQTYDEIQELRDKYPRSRSAVMDALRLAQEEHGGWLPPEALREVADALDVTPAFCHSIASFYDMYHLEPVGSTWSRCARTSRARSQAPRPSWTLSRASSASGPARRPTTARSRCARSSARAAAAALRSSSSTTSTTSRCAPKTCPASSRSSVDAIAAMLLMAGTEEHDLTRLDEYRAVGGYAALDKARALEPQAVMDEISAATLRGRGGAGFPMGRKASLLAKDTGKPTYLVINADESEPGAFKDRDVLRMTPHRLIEGCLITAHGIGSESVFIYIRGEYAHEFDVMRDALEDARTAGLLGGVTIVLHRGAGAYICGEETALLESLEGQRGQPRPRPPFPPVNGLYAAPTQINNVSTIALVPKIIELGAAEFSKIGVPSAPGTAVFSLSGNVAQPGNYERPLGITLRELIYDVAGGIAGGRELKAVIPGGSSVPC